MTGGVFTITLYHLDTSESQTQKQQVQDSEVVPPSVDLSSRSVNTSVIWDRKRDGGFPETKELKNRVRNIIEPGKDMGHVDRALRKGREGAAAKQDGPADGQGKVSEASTKESTVPSTSVQVLGEGERQVAGKTTVHAEHKDGKSPPDDCEECKEAMKS